MDERFRPWVPWTILQILLFIAILQCFPLLIIGYHFAGLRGSQLLQCYRSTKNHIPELQEFLVPIGRSFFFHETSCSPHYERDFPLNARRACAVESAAFHHPDHLVYLIILAPVRKSFNETKNKAVQALLKYSNIRIRHVFLEKYLDKTPLDILPTKLRRSFFPVEHVSDVIRIASLYKFQGTYLDLDIIVLKPINDFKNFAGAENKISIGNGIMNFHNDTVGRTMAWECAKEIRTTYNGSIWAYNGPGVFTRVLQRKCNTTSISNMFNADCQGFNVFPARKVYALPYEESQKFFKKRQLGYVRGILNESIVTHFWNSDSSKYRILQPDLSVPFLYYAKFNCPFVYNATNGTF